MSADYTEIERKWTYALPVPEDFQLLSCCTVERQYLSVEPEVRLTRRIRPEGERYNVTFKGGGTLRRTEVRIRLSAEEYARIQSLIARPPLVLEVQTYRSPKGRRIALKHCIPLDLRFAEIEFDSLEDSRSADSWPTDFPFFMEEVTEDPRYYVKTMWQTFYGR